MKSPRSFAKPVLLLSAASILAAVVSAQIGQSQATNQNIDSRSFSLLYQMAGGGGGGGTTTGTTGGSGGIITGAAPRPISEVTVINPTLTQRP